MWDHPTPGHPEDRGAAMGHCPRRPSRGLNVVESWNRANSIVFYGKSDDPATDRRDEQEMSVQCLLDPPGGDGLVNTLMLQDVLADTEWEAVPSPEDRRSLTPLFWSHVLPYGEVKRNELPAHPQRRLNAVPTTRPVAVCRCTSAQVCV